MYINNVVVYANNIPIYSYTYFASIQRTSCFPYRDIWSYISQNDLGLGRSRRDEALMPFIPMPLSTDMRYKVELPDGIPIWVKLHLTDAGIYF